MKGKRFISVLLAAAMGISMLAGCSSASGGTAQTSAKTEGTQGTTAGADATAGTQAVDSQDRGAPVEISIADYNNSEWGNDAISDYIEEKFNVRFVPMPFSRSDWKDKVKLWASQDELPNVFRTIGIYDADTFYQFVDNGIIRDIPEDMLMSRPNIKQMLEDNPVYKEFAVDGKIYSLPHTYWRTQEEDWKGGVTWARKDWREKLGIDVPVTLDDWTAMMDAFANGDPDGNGKKDTYGITYFREEIPTFIFNAHGAFIEEWVEEDGLVGIIPETSDDGVYDIMYRACEDLEQMAVAMDGYLAIETGCETAAHLAGFLKNFKSGRICVNYDPANLVMVTGDDPVAGVELLKAYIVHTHAKDGIRYGAVDPKLVYGYPGMNDMSHTKIAQMVTRGAYFREAPVGEGQVPFPEYVQKLKDVGYDGYLTIERESQREAEAELKDTVAFLRELIGK